MGTGGGESWVHFNALSRDSENNGEGLGYGGPPCPERELRTL
jgi:hypothetical protein